MVFCCPGWPDNPGLTDKIPPFFEYVYIKKCGLYVKQNIEWRHSDRRKKMLNYISHYKVSQFDNVLMVHVYMRQTKLNLNWAFQISKEDKISFIFIGLSVFILLKFETLRDCRSCRIYCVRCRSASLTIAGRHLLPQNGISLRSTFLYATTPPKAGKPRQSLNLGLHLIDCNQICLIRV